MITSVRGWRRVGVAALGLALTLSGAAVSADPAQAVPSSADNTIAPVRGVLGESTANAVGIVTYTEDSPGQFFRAGVATTVTLKLSSPATFTPGVTPTVTVPTGYQSAATPTAGPASDTYTFTVTAPATAVKAVVTVSGLQVNVGSIFLEGQITLTSTPGDSNGALRVLTSGRLGGQDRYETAADIFALGVDSEVFIPESVVLASGAGYADALSANYLAGELRTGTLLTRSGSLSPVTQDVMEAYGVATVYITGGTGAVSKAVEDKLRGLHVGGNPTAPKLQVIRLGGKDRYATNQVINEYAEDGFPADSETALLASGLGYADALALGPVAYTENFPIILTPGKTLGSVANAQLTRLQPAHVVLAGGTASISSAVEDQLRRQYPDVNRYGGADRTATAATVANWADRNPTFGTDFDTPVVAVANGLGYADALAMAPLAGAEGFLVLLSKNSNELGAGTSNYLGVRSINDIVQVIAAGSTGSISDQVLARAANAVGSSTTGAARSARANRPLPKWLHR